MTGSPMRIAVVVVTWNGERWIAECLDSVASQEQVPHVVVVDNGSDDGTVRTAESKRPAIEEGGAQLEIVRLDTNTGFVEGANRGVEIVLGDSDPKDAILLLNQDAVLEPGCLAAFVDAMHRHPRGGAFGAKIVYPGSGTIQHAGGSVVRPRMAGLHNGHHEPDEAGAYSEEREVDFVTGAAMMLRSQALRGVGLFHEIFSPGYYEDVDLCDRLREAGWLVLYTPAARVQHHESSSFADRHARLRLAHRNRYIYALPRFSDGDFSEDFVAAEIDFLTNHASFDEVRAVSGGTLEALVRLVQCLRIRSRNQEVAPSAAVNARRALLQVRETCSRLLRNG